ncbi:MAG: MerR family DNA-binding protein [Rhodospirillales bacterium]|nr:MerR family DNA-binding protein [Rhodospirillales bacterium]
MPPLATLPFAALAEKSGVDIETLATYERLGLLSKPRRPANGLILYPADEDRRVTFIKRSFELGFSAEAIHEMVSLGRGKQKSCQEIYAIAERQLADIRRRLDDLARIERTLAPLVESCPRRGNVADCIIVNALSHTSTKSRAVPERKG